MTNRAGSSAPATSAMSTPGGRPPGPRFTTGSGPFTLADETTVVEIQRPRRLVLQAKARPAGPARITLELEPVRSSGTMVTLL
ncbi:MAG: hypothetical protein M3Z33_05540 [Actinomycetota bacterium]|nr:hypothetical protein [Actinomycetota bacterium]